MAVSEEELKSLLIKVKQESEKVGLKNEVSQSCPTLCDPMDCNLLGSSVPGILQARIQEWVAISFSGCTLHISYISRVTIYSLDILLSLCGASLLFHVQF